MIVDRALSFELLGLLNDNEKINKCIYLSSLINDEGNCEPEVKKCMANSAISRHDKIWKKRTITNTTKIRIFYIIYLCNI